MNTYPAQLAVAARALAPYLLALEQRVRNLDEVEADLIRPAARVCIETVDGELFPTEVVRSAARALARIDTGRWNAAVETWPRAPRRCRLGFEFAQQVFTDGSREALQAVSSAEDGVDVKRHQEASAAYCGMWSVVESLRWHTAPEETR